MPPLTERVELRLDAEIVARLDDWRKDMPGSPSRSESIRLLLQEGFRSTEQANLRPSQTERLMLWLMSETLKLSLEAKGGRSAETKVETVSLIGEAIASGHFWALNWEMPGVLHQEIVDPKKVGAVVDILDMWTFIERGYENLNDTERSALDSDLGYPSMNPQFIGFDGNNETEYMSIARFLVEKLGRFSTFRGRIFNSHSQTFGRYWAMAQAFEPIRAKLIGREMSADELRSLLSR